jgi:hypothetical protein
MAAYGMKVGADDDLDVMDDEAMDKWRMRCMDSEAATFKAATSGRPTPVQPKRMRWEQITNPDGDEADVFASIWDD